MAESPGILLLDAEDNSEAGLTVTEEGSNNFSIATGAKAHGTYGYNFAFSGNSGENLCYFYKSFTAGADIYARCYFYIPSGFGMDASYLSILILRYGTGSGNNAANVRFYNSSGTIRLERLYYYINTGVAYTDLSVNISRDEWHYMEIRYKSGNGDGVVTLWLDGTQITTQTELTNNNYQAGYIFAGNAQGGVPTAGSAFYIDDIKIDSSYIGAYAESGGASGGPLVGASALVGGGVLCGQGNLIN